MKQRIVGIILTLALCLTLLPTAALAEEADSSATGANTGSGAIPAPVYVTIIGEPKIGAQLTALTDGEVYGSLFQ